MKRLRPAFMVTAMVSTACSSETTRNPPVPDGSQRALSSAPVSATASAGQTASAPLRKRVGKRIKGERKEAPRGAYLPLHPKDKEGSYIELADDDTCYVVVPKTTPPPKDLNTGERWTDNVPVDCPPEFDDPAWDSLQAGESLGWDEKTGLCAFLPWLGNPPPPPLEAGCPKTLPKRK
jgi:hypothetical protein